MKKEDLIVKWLDNNLDENELKAFKQLDASSVFIKIDAAAQQFKAPPFDVDNSYQRLKEKNAPSRKISNWKRNFVGIAATLVISLGLYFSFFHTMETTFFAQKTEKIEFNLPDSSLVFLNAGSTITYQEKNWEESRNLTLEGEAFFKVSPGSKFTVNTSQGAISVLGTQFMVKSRPDFFGVVCYEGLVQVEYKGKFIELGPGKSFMSYGNETYDTETMLEEPGWLHAKSNFTSVPYSEVVQELERQYNLKVLVDDTFNNTLFTGSFTHANLETALQAITIPLNLSYTINGNNVVLKSN